MFGLLRLAHSPLATVFRSVLALAVATAVLPGLADAQEQAARGARGMVVTPDPVATEVGLDVLRRGGNAVDAAVAVAFSLAVTHPLAGNLGGGGFLLYRDEHGKHHALDFRETAPSGLRAERFLDEDGRPIPGLSLSSGLAVGVPGSVAGLATARESWGSRPLAELVEPAVRLAAQGFEVRPYLAARLAEGADKLARDPAARSIFTRDGRPIATGERLVQTDLAASLRRIVDEGPAGFYRGPVADALVRTVSRYDGVLTADDLAGFRPVPREPVEGRYRGFRVVSFPPPSSGGIALLQMLGMLEGWDLAAAGAGSSRAAHLLIEVERRAYADRSRWLGDADFYPVPRRGLLRRRYLRRRAAEIDPHRATPSARVLPGAPRGAPRGGETLHFSVADERGRAVALTTTLNTNFGSGIVAEGTGILLNNEIDDFALAPGVPNTYGLIGGEANAIVGGKRPLSSMTPTIVEPPGGGPRPVLVLGSPGGSTIITAVLQVLVNVVDFHMPLQQAVDAPRFHHQWRPDDVRYEPGAFSADVLAALAGRGHRLRPASGPLGNVNAIGIAADGTWLGAADPRRQGLAAGF